MTRNSYATLAEFRAWKEITNTDAERDSVVSSILESVSRYLDGQTGRRFYPRIETRYYSVPDGRQLLLDDDLLAVVEILNGDAAALPATEYHLIPKNATPAWAIRIKETSAYYWATDADGGDDLVIGVTGYWGYHHLYSIAWRNVGTLDAAITSTSATSFTMTSASSVTAGMILRIDNELLNVSSVAANTVTIFERGDNGSTAATHSSGAIVYAWRPMDDVRLLTLEIAHNVFMRRFGEAAQSTATITAAGVVITPKDISRLSHDTIVRLRRVY